VVRRCKQHEYTEALDVGGGIVRIACSQCGSVHLELSSDDTIARAGLFQSGRVRWMAWEPDAAPVIQYERTFGKRSARRRKAQPAVA
jgi:hypothetical protein